MQEHFPRGTRLSALEKNELKRRALEMVMLLFYIEDLKKFVVSSIRATDSRHDDPAKHRLPNGTKGLYKAAWATLAAAGVLTQDEADEIEKLIDYRNLIAHETQNLIGDIGRNPSARIRNDEEQYNFDALKRIRHVRKKITAGMMRNFILVVSFRGILFEAAEQTYAEELKRLESKIRRQAKVAKQEVDEANAAIDQLRHSGLLKILQPGHPDQVSRSGTLTPQGLNCCKRLFDAGASPFVVAHLMRLSLRAANKQYRVWQATA
jgi:hypothetical protein